MTATLFLHFLFSPIQTLFLSASIHKIGQTETADSQRHQLDVFDKMAGRNSTAACANNNETLRSVVKALSAFHANSPSHSLGSQVSMPILIQIIVFAYQIAT